MKAVGILFGLWQNCTDSLPSVQSKPGATAFHTTAQNLRYVAFCLVSRQKFDVEVALSFLSISVDIFNFLCTTKVLVQMVAVVFYFLHVFLFYFVLSEPTKSKHTNPSCLLIMTNWKSETLFLLSTVSRKRKILWEHFHLHLSVFVLFAA